MDEGGSRNRAFLSEEAQCGGPLGRVPLLGTLEDMLREALDMGISHPGAPLRNLEGIRLLGLLREKDCISGFLSLTQRTLNEPSGTFGKGQGFPQLISDYGAQRARL